MPKPWPVAAGSSSSASKEGLFEACLAQAEETLTRSVDRLADLCGVADTMSEQGLAPSHDHPSSYLLLLMRSSGGETLRTGILRDLTERLAAIAGWTPDHPDGDTLLIRAQLILCTGMGMAAVRATGNLEPLATASKEALEHPIQDLVRAMLG